MPHVRPTTDRAKESLFSILEGRYYMEDISVVDAYCGMGSVGLEFWSRGCENATLVDASPKSIKYIKRLVDDWDAKVAVKCQKVLPFLEQLTAPVDILFADPPYHAGQEIQSLIDFVSSNKCIKEGGCFILEHASALHLASPNITEKRSYGQSTFSFFTFE